MGKKKTLQYMNDVPLFVRDVTHGVTKVYWKQHDVDIQNKRAWSATILLSLSS